MAESPDREQLEQIFKQAAALASTMPPALQEVAFNRALDALLHPAGNPAEAREPQHDVRGHRVLGPNARRPLNKSVGSVPDPVETLVALPRDRAEAVDDEEGALGKALALLTVAEQEAQIEGLTAPQIAQVLTRKFKWKVSRQAITQALDRAGKMVDSTSSSGARVYQIMDAGTRYLATPVTERQTSSAGSAARRRSPTRRSRKSTVGDSNESAETNGPATSTTRGPRRAPRKSGPTEAIEQLIASGYFSSARLLGEIREELRDRRGLVYKSTDLSPVMTRALREGRLTRQRNRESQYEYISD